MEVNEGLHVGGFDLDDNPDEEDDEECLDDERTARNEFLCLFGEELWHEMEQIAQEHQEGNGFVRGTPLQEYLRLELAEYLMEDLLCDAERRGTEEHPTSCHHVEGDYTTHQRHQPILLGSLIMLTGQIGQRTEEGTEAVPHLVETKEHTVNTSPEDKVKGGTMPKTSKEHGQEKVEVLTELAVTVASKGDVEVVLEP